MKVFKIMVNILILIGFIYLATLPFSRNMTSTLRGINEAGSYAVSEFKYRISGDEDMDSEDFVSDAKRKEIFREKMSVYFKSPTKDYSPEFHMLGMILYIVGWVIVGIWMGANMVTDSDDITALYEEEDEHWL